MNRGGESSNTAVERTVGSHALATAADRERSSDEGGLQTGP